MRDLAKLIAQGEGQYLEFKSALHGPPNAKKARAGNEVRDDIAENVTAFANVDGGTLLIGVEDDGTVTGCSYPQDKLEAMLSVPLQRCKPPLLRGAIEPHDGKDVLVFDVASASQAVMVVGNGFPRRVGDEVILESEASIDAIKARARNDSVEAEVVTGARLDQLDASLILLAKSSAGLAAATDAEYLVTRRLADRHGDNLVLRAGALLLFARQPEFVPFLNAGVRILAVRGTARTTGANLNTNDIARIEGALPRVIQRVHEVLNQHIRKSTKLHDLFFREVPEYPAFAWQEAVVNAVAHRDYRIQGRGVEVWLFDDRLEVRSPGELLPGITLESLARREMSHESRGRVLSCVRWSWNRTSASGGPKRRCGGRARGATRRCWCCGPTATGN